MTNTKFAIGLDFGTESGRALVIDVATGREVGSAVHHYADGVIDERLPGTTIRLGPDWALQNPQDYIETLKHAVPEALRQGGVRAEDVIGIGVDFTACTILPTRNDGTPLCFMPAWKNHPHAWVKLWKHHAAQPEADRINIVARERNEWWLPYYGGKISSEWLHSKTLQILDEAPEIYQAAEQIIEAGDWVVWQLTGQLRRNACAAGYKALWSRERGYPSNDFLRALDPRLVHFNETKLSGAIVAPGTRVGTLTAQAAQWMGLHTQVAVAAATIDAHAAVPGASVTEPARMVLILGTSTCHMLLDTQAHLVPGISGVVSEGIVPNLYGYEAGQAGVGDIFEWFVKHGVPPEYHERARQANTSVYALLMEEAAQLKPGESGLLALDWWNGNRSVLVDAELSGLLVGATLSTRAPDIYRALIEATAFGTQLIIEAFEQNGVAVHELVACGGLAERNPLLMQIYADVTGRPFKQAAAAQTSALGAAMFGALAAGQAAGGYDAITEAATRMAQLKDKVYEPMAAHHAVYRQLCAEYRRLHDYFGRGENGVMKVLRRVREG
jgi:L-ribulokinase